MISNKNQAYQLLKFIGRKSLFWFGVSIVCSVLMTGVELALSIVLILLLHSLGITTQMPALPFGWGAFAFGAKFFVVLLMAIGFLRSVFQFLVNQTTTFSNSLIVLRLQQVLLFKYFRRPKFEGSLAEFNYYNAEIFLKSYAFCSGVAVVLPALIQASLLGVILLLRNTELTLAGVAGLGVSAYLISVISKHAAGFSRVIRDRSISWNKRIVRSIRNWNMLRALRLMDQEYRYIANDQFTQNGLTIRSAFFTNLASSLPQFLGVVVVTGLVAFQLKYPKVSGIEFFAYLYLFFRFVQTLGGSASNFGMLANNYPQFKTAVELFFSLNPKEITQAVSKVGLLKITGSNWETIGVEAMFTGPKNLLNRTKTEPPEIRISNVTFAHDGAENILSNLSGVVPSGTALAIVGPSGAGKSTLLSIILGVLAPQKGAITIEGISPEEYFEKNPYGVGYVGADPFLIHGSLKENILYGNPFHVSDEEMMESLQLARLQDWVQTLPDGLDYVITENGEGLSTGQKQRLSLARAFLRKPALLILDEISANLDVTTEAEIAVTLKQMNYSATMLIVSHRTALIEHVSNRIDLTPRHLNA